MIPSVVFVYLGVEYVVLEPLVGFYTFFFLARLDMRRSSLAHPQR